MPKVTLATDSYDVRDGDDLVTYRRGDQVEVSKAEADRLKALGAVEDSPSASVDPADLKGKALDDALAERGLSTEGSADEKRERLAASQV